MTHSGDLRPQTGAKQPSQPPRLLEQVRQQALQRGHPHASAVSFVDWSRRFILFWGKKHPRELDLAAVTRFLQHVVQTETPPLPALEAARSALDFLYREVLGIALGELPRPQPPKLLDQVRQIMRVRHYSPRTEHCYVNWMRRYIIFHDKRHPRDMGTAEIEEFLTDLAVSGHVSASTQNQALNALVFLYSQVLEIELDRLDAVRARRPKRLPVVLSRDEVRRALELVTGADGVFRIMAHLLYGSGLRLMECCQLRVKDIHLERNQIVVRGGKGDKDRVVMLPRTVRADLIQQIEVRRRLHERDLARGVARVELPHALERKYPKAAQEFGWQFVFASRQLSECPQTGRQGRHHVFPGSVQRAVAQAGKAAAFDKPLHCHTFRHSFATHLVERNIDIRTVQLLLRHESLETTMIYTHVARQGVSGITSPLDLPPDVYEEEIRAVVDANQSFSENQ